MIVTRFNYPLEKYLVKKLDLMIQRCNGKGSKKDVVLLIEGGEGEGKTTMSIAIAYYISEKTQRPFSEANIFFNLEDLIQFAQDTKEQIIIWDEPALQALATDWNTKIVKDLTRLLMMARKKRHFIMINMTKFYKFNEYIVVDRAIGMVHIYSRKNVESGRFRYIKKKNLEPLWRDYRFGKKRNYAKYSDPVTKGTFPDLMNYKYKNNVLSEFNLAKYESEKDKAISSIGIMKKVETPAYIQMRTRLKIMKNLQNLPLDLTQAQISQILGVKSTTTKLYAKKLALSPIVDA